MRTDFEYIKYRIHTFKAYTYFVIKSDFSKVIKTLRRPSFWIYCIILITIYSFFKASVGIILIFIFILFMLLVQKIKSGEDIRWIRDQQNFPFSKHSPKRIKEGKSGSRVIQTGGTDEPNLGRSGSNSTMDNLPASSEPENPEARNQEQGS